MDSIPALLPHICSAPLPRQTTQKRRQIAVLRETLTGTYAVPPSLEISIIMWFTLQLLLIQTWPRQSFSLPAGTLVVSYCPWLSVTAQCLLEDCCLITLRSHSTPPVSRWRTEESFSCFTLLVLGISVNRFNVYSEWISNSTTPSFYRGLFCTGGGGDDGSLRISFTNQWENLGPVPVIFHQECWVLQSCNQTWLLKYLETIARY